MLLRNVQDLFCPETIAAHGEHCQVTPMPSCPSCNATHVADTRQLADKLHTLRAARNTEKSVHPRLSADQGKGLVSAFRVFLILQTMCGKDHLKLDQSLVFEAPSEESERPVERLGPTSSARSPPDFLGAVCNKPIHKSRASKSFRTAC